MDSALASFTDILDAEICDSQPLSLTPFIDSDDNCSAPGTKTAGDIQNPSRPCKGTGQHGEFRSTEEIDPKYRNVFTYKYFNLVQSKVIDDALYSDKSIVVCAPTGSGKTVLFEMAIVQLLMELEDRNYTEDFKIIYMAPVKALCTERLTEWYPKFTKLGLLCIEATGDTDVDFSQLQPYKIIITTPEKWDMLTRRWRDHRSMVEVIKLFLIDEVHILNDETRGPVLEAVVSRMKTIESSAQSVHRIEKLQNQLQGSAVTHKTAPSIRFVAVSATVSNPEDVANWLGTSNKSAVFHKFGDECRPVKLNRIVEGYPCPAGTSIFKFDIILNYRLWPIIQKHHRGKPTLIFCNTRKSVTLTAETLSRELTINFNAEQKAKLTALASTIKNKKLQSLVMCGVGCHHAGLLYEERQVIERAFRNRDLPILITTTTLAMGVNLPAHLVIIKNTQQYVNGTFQEYSISTVLQMVGRAGRPQFDTDATAVIMTRLADKGRYQALVGGCEPLQSYLHKRLPENLNSEAALGTVGDVAQCVEWLRSTFLYVRAARDPKRYLGLPQNSPQHLISKKIEELCVKAMNGLASSGLITMDEASCIECTEAGRLMSIFYLDVETMKLLMRIEGTEPLERLLAIICESHELSDMHLRIDERRCLNALNRNQSAATIRFPMKGKISTRQMKLNCTAHCGNSSTTCNYTNQGITFHRVIQAVLGCLAIPDPSLNQEAMKIMRIADRVCKCLVAYVTRPDLVSRQPKFYLAVINSIVLAKCIAAHLWENSPFVSKQLKGIGPTFSTLLATAGKVNFMLLEESHPRDLERIMNKGPPAGNVLRRQISLLPKYQLLMTPIDENSVMIQLKLLNQNFLAENVEHLTAGGTHKCYFVVGDSTNQLLLLSSFKDTDLLGIFDGTISHVIKRQHNCEHRIFAHCISSTFVGLDVQSDYVFKDLNKLFGSPNTNLNINEKLTNDTIENENESLRKRKRNKSTDTDKNQTRGKKKKENAIIKNFEYMKKKFETESQVIKENFHVNPNNTEDVNYDEIAPRTEIVNKNKINAEPSNMTKDMNLVLDIDSDNFIDNDENINKILTEIEKEMYKRKSYEKKSNFKHLNNCSETGNPEDSSALKYKTINKVSYQHRKSNYTFIDLLERNVDFSDDNDEAVEPTRHHGFSESVKGYINKFILKTETQTNVQDTNIQSLLSEDKAISDRKEYSNEIAITESDSEKNSPTHKLCPHYEIKEILGGQENIKETEVNTSSQKLVTKVPSNVVTDNNETCQINENVVSLLFKQSDAVQESSMYHDNQNHSNTLNSTLNCIFSKPNSSQVEYESNPDNIHVDCREFPTKTNRDNIPLSDKETVLSSTKNSLKIDEITSDILPFIRKSTNTTDISPTKIAITEDNNLSVMPITYKPNGCNIIDSTCRKTMQQNVQRIEEIRGKNCIIPDLLKTDDYKRAITLKHFTNSDSCQIINVTTAVNNNDQEIIFKPIYTNNYNYPQLMNYCSSNAYCDGNRNEYVKKYYLSTREVDIETREMNDYNIRVIKEIKMDLNITAIVSANRSQQSYSAESDVINTDIIKNSENNLSPMPIHEDEQINNYDNKAKMQCAQPAVNWNLQNKDKPNKTVDHVRASSTRAGDNTKNMFNDRNYSSYEEMNNIQNISQDITVNSRKDSELINAINNKIYDSDNLIGVKCPLLREGEENDNILKTPPNEVHNLLKKYSKILGKETMRDQPPVYATSNKNTANKRTPLKSKKPFQIRNIKYLQAPVPETIINFREQNQLKCHEIPMATKIVSNEETQCGNIRVQGNSINDRRSYQPIPDVELEPLNIPDEISLQPDLDQNIDQSMFDPKTLLQCTFDTDSNEIYSPPPQFCDYNTISQNYCDTDETDVVNNSQQFNESQIGFSLNTNTEFNYNDSIFEDCCTPNLTPSREIETWILGEQECPEGRSLSLSLSPAKSFTVLRRNNLKGYFPSFPSNNIEDTSRKAHLRKFKFTHKSKLKKWK